MGAVESKKDGVIKRYQIKVDLHAPIQRELLALANWSFPDIKSTYDAYCRKGDCPFIDFFSFHKILPYTTQASRHMFTSFTQGQQYVNIYELICTLVLTSHNNYRKKLQFLFVIFDFNHAEKLTNRQFMLIFQSMLNGFCRVTGQRRPKYDYLTRYTIQRFIRVNTLQAYEKIVSYRRLIEQVEGNNDCFELFKRFDQQIYTFFTQESYLFKCSQYKKYENEDIEKIFRIIKKVNLDKNYEEIEMVDKNRQFRLENRKIQCIQHLLEEKEEKFKKDAPTLKTRANSMILKPAKLPILNTHRPSLAKFSPKINQIQTLSSQHSKNINKNKVLFLNNKIQGKQDIFQTIQYFKTLSGGKAEIKAKQFFGSFEKKIFMKKQVGALFKYFDMRKKGEIKFQDFLQVYYQNITKSEIQLIKHWYQQYKSIHEADHFNLGDKTVKKDKKSHVQLPKTTLKRIDQLFSSIDRQKKGYLVLQDLKKAYSTGFTIKQLEDMIRDFGDNNKIFKEGFIKMTLPEDWTIEGTDYVGA